MFAPPYEYIRVHGQLDGPIAADQLERPNRGTSTRPSPAPTKPRSPLRRPSPGGLNGVVNQTPDPVGFAEHTADPVSAV